jgi:hypothetical protein
MQFVKHFFKQTCALLWLCAALAWGPELAYGAGSSALAARDLTIELRQIDESKIQNADRDGAAAVGKSFSAGAASSTEWESQMVQVRNGERAALRMQSATPMQWVQAAYVQADKSGAKATGAGVQNAITWFDAGQSITALPKWSGGKSAVVELEVLRTGFEARTGADLPSQSRNTVSTTITAPLAQWVTIATTGRTPQAASYSSESAQQLRRLLQIRVMVP